MYKKGYKITAIDIIPEMVEASKEAMKNTNIQILQMDAANLSFKNDSFDFVFFPFHGIDYIFPNIFLGVKEATRVLKPDGIFIFNSHNRFFIKEVSKIFSGRYTDYHGLTTYRSTFMDFFRLKKYFEKVNMVQRISLISWKNSKFKDIVYKIFPFLNKSTYFICSHPKKYYDNRN